MRTRTMTSSDSSGSLPLAFAWRLLPRVTVGGGHCLPEGSLVPPLPVPACRAPSAGEFFGGASPDSPPLPWPSPGLTGAAFSCPWRVHISTLQDALHVTDCWFAPLAQRGTPLQHPRLPKGTGRRLRGSPVMTTAGLPPASKR